ncbi:RAB6A-GEF complex partner protein 2-like [Saccoglossus kowalevskii]|uniref:Retrograde Golgi transport protein RGP1 homolog n=1 Tax=Saccoglossus kowalevskii TaxID=10224 RepID=A0ABM0GZ26_SACKO|nr:PREDICTED: retrograde Golgi transport protein RGP1 homolog [Saccoglossus kowalevskii]
MIEVIANIVRGSVFLAGETLECTVTFSNPVCDNVSTSKPDTLTWASAQLSCQCNVSESRVIQPPRRTDLSQSGNTTSFVPARGERGVTVVSTHPRILFCNLTLSPGESKTFIYRERIPRDAPPSYKGQSVKYSYKVTIGTQRLNSATKLLRIPFRVLVVYGLGDTSIYEESQRPSNPFLAEQKKETSLLDMALQVITTITSRRTPNFYNITNDQGKVGRFCLFKPAYKIGEDIIATFDFSGATIPCLQFSVALQSEENISEECRRKPSQTSAVTTYSKHEEFCLHTTKSHIQLPIPLHLTPGFITDIVCLWYHLHFEFITASQPLPDHVIPADQSESSTWQGPKNVEVETMVWDLPVKIVPTNPLQATSISIARASNSVNV